MWDFIQGEIFGMRWLHKLTGDLVSLAGLDISEGIGGAVHFFIYDSIKIMILLVTLIFMISYIQSYFSPERSKKILGRYKGLTANTVAALLGTVTPFCACSSIPLFMGFTRAGLPVGVTFSFLISSPMVDLGSLFLLGSIFGFKLAFIYVITGLVIAVIGGTVLDKLNMERYVEDFVKVPATGSAGSCCSSADPSAYAEDSMGIKERLAFASEQVRFTVKKVWLWILVGVGAGAVIHNFIPAEFISNLLGSDNQFGVILAVFAGIPMYADIFGVIPVAEALLKNGAEIGTVMSFMMAVITLSVPSLILLRRVVKMPLLLSFVAVCTAGIIAVGYLFNAFAVLMI